MAPISHLLTRDEDPSANSNLAYYLLITCVAIFVSGVLTIISYCIFRRSRRTRRQRAQALIAATQNEANQSTSSLTSVSREKAALLDDEPKSPTVGSPPPQIRLTLPEENIAGHRQSRVVVVTMSENGSVGYAPYHEPLPIYQQKESTRFQSLDLERIGGLKETHAM